VLVADGLPLARPATFTTRGRIIGMKSDSFREFVLEQLAALGGVQSRRMFGDWGLYFGDVFFGIIADERLYLKTDEASRTQYVNAGMGPFRPNPKQTLVTYYEVPVDVIEDHDSLADWTRRAIRAQGSR
jgi:DNA transformation protein